MIGCTITGIAQELDFAKNITVTYLTLVLPNGNALRVSVDDAAAAAVMEQHVHANGAPQSVVQAPAPAATQKAAAPEQLTDEEEITPAPAVVHEETAEDGTSTHIFGGQDAPADGGAMAAEEELLLKEGSPTLVVTEAPAATAPAKAPVTRAKHSPNGRLVPSRTVPAAEKGYPIVPGAGIDTSELTGGRDPDEDGVGSV